MTLWTFNLRSNDSDIEDEEAESPCQNATTSHTSHSQHPNTRQKQINHELEELFGTTEENIEYKPNPWSIAKINAHSRNTAPKPKPTWKATGNPGWRSSGPRSWKKPTPSVKDERVVFTETSPNSGKSLRDSISSALRRGGPVTTVGQDPNIEDRENQRMERPKGWLEPLATDTIPSLDINPLPDSYVYPPVDSDQEQMSSTLVPHQPGTYIPNGHFTLPLYGEPCKETQRLDIPEELCHEDTYVDELATLSSGSGDQHTSDDSSCLSPFLVHDGAASSIGSMHMPANPRPDLRWENPSLPDHFGPASPELGSSWNSQNLVHLVSPYSDSPIKNKLEPSPTVQLIARFAAPKLNEPAASRDSEARVNRAESPTFAWSPPSPTPSYTQTTRNQVYPLHTPERTSRPTRDSFYTPPRNKLRRRFDPDDKPFWSTLPTPPRSNFKPPTDGIKASRFRLPGEFLASGSSGRVLYKPPPRKRTRSRGDEDSGRKWKVTRVG
ncbi:hypothetical protein RSOLAG22IIIB_10831 [Rhizoctonia solani]|uniref:Uncharacterized protein n=1 Tax=Rhizoctonia solani TaxID=456999 RepID=A0A0K6G5F9_9AGAM|nr:hypothetical protein RSOLAG22IIIB_10831 [Rhizoctonia solani]